MTDKKDPAAAFRVERKRKSINVCFCLVCGGLFAVSLLIATGLCGPDGRWYSESIPHRSQTEAFFRGEIRLSSCPQDIDFDLAWTRGGLQQLWGLAVPLWRMPWEVVAKLCGKSGFPDRLVFGFAVFMVASLAFHTFFFLPACGASMNHLMGATGTILLCVAFPPWIGLCSTAFDVYEETIAYSYLYAILLLCLLERFRQRPSAHLCIVLCVFSGFSGFVRPTLLAYGFASILAIPIICYQQRKNHPKISRSLVSGTLAGLVLAALCITALFWTNYFRFGSILEFGHGLNVEDAGLSGSMYSTRFDSPYRDETFCRATRELFGIMFLEPKPSTRGWFESFLFNGQSDTLRVRSFEFRTYDITYFFLLVAGWIVATSKLLSQRRHVDSSRRIIVYSVWSFLAATPLFLFYLRCPVIASRYTLDFAASFVALTSGLWYWFVHELGKNKSKTVLLGCLALATWQIYQYINISGNALVTAVRWDQVRQTIPQVHTSLQIGNNYYYGDPVGRAGIPYNGTGWYQDGSTAPLVVLFVDECEFVELQVKFGREVLEEVVRKEIRAKIALEHLSLDQVSKRGDVWVLRFRLPNHYDAGLEPLFVALAPKEGISNFVTDVKLISVKWRTD